MSKPFIYDVKSASLYGPDGVFIKEVCCPKAIKWNQLLTDDPQDRSRGCNLCSERVINLDTTPVADAVALLNEDQDACVYSSPQSINVIHLVDTREPLGPYSEKIELHLEDKPSDLPIIYTARSFEEMHQAAQKGYWPDVRLIEYKDYEIREKLAIYQNKITGELDSFGDYRCAMSGAKPDADSGWECVIDFTFYYPHYQQMPFAAYLIPKDLMDGSEVLVVDPIEDFLGSSWNQGDTYRATNLKGKLINKKIVIDPQDIHVQEFMG